MGLAVRPPSAAGAWSVGRADPDSNGMQTAGARPAGDVIDRNSTLAWSVSSLPIGRFGRQSAAALRQRDRRKIDGGFLRISECVTQETILFERYDMILKRPLDNSLPIFHSHIRPIRAYAA